MNRKIIKEALVEFINQGEPHSQNDFELFFQTLELEHRKAMRPLYVSLAQIGIGIIEHAEDTVWVSKFETAIDRIFNELALDMDCNESLVNQLKNFVNSEVLWPERLKEMKEELPVQLELNLQNEN